MNIEIALIDRAGNGILKETLYLDDVHTIDDMDDILRAIQNIRMTKLRYPHYEEWARVI